MDTSEQLENDTKNRTVTNRSITPEFFSFSPSNNILNKRVDLQTLSTASILTSAKNEPNKDSIDTDIMDLSANIPSSVIEPSKNKILDPVSIIQSQNNSPLTMVKSKSYVPKTISNTPKQTSIFNFIKTPIRKQLTPKQQSSQDKSGSDKIYDVPMDITPVKQKRDICITCTRLNAEENVKLVTMSDKYKITFSKQFSSKITHLVVAVDDKNRIKDLTMKYISAIANGIWIVSFLWVQDCLQHDRILSEVSCFFVVCA